MGPTATGKTDLAIKLAADFPVEIISVDSAMIYRGMDIGTAKPSKAILQQFPHALIDIKNPDETYSVGLFFDEAHLLIADILKRNKIPLLVGGTMMYFNSLQKGLSYLPPSAENVRQMLNQEAKALGWEKMHAKLRFIDKTTAAKINPQDSQRIMRALEIYQITGKPLSILQKTKPKTKAYNFVNFVLYPATRDKLHAKIAERFKGMLQKGLIEEVQCLLAKWPNLRQAPSMKSVGYRQVLAYLDGLLTQDELAEKAIAATRQLAKRQCTWLKSWQNPLYIDPYSQDPYKIIQKRIEKW